MNDLPIAAECWLCGKKMVKVRTFKQLRFYVNMVGPDSFPISPVSSRERVCTVF